MIVVDTNVIAYFIVPGEMTDQAEGVRNKDPEWAAPKLWRSEMRNLLALYLRQRLIPLTDAKGYMSDAELLLSGNEHDVASDRVLELAKLSGCTSYDCEFVFVAESLGAPLVTSDKKLLSAFSSIAVSMNDFMD